MTSTVADQMTVVSVATWSAGELSLNIRTSPVWCASHLFGTLAADYGRMQGRL